MMMMMMMNIKMNMNINMNMNMNIFSFCGSGIVGVTATFQLLAMVNSPNGLRKGGLFIRVSFRFIFLILAFCCSCFSSVPASLLFCFSALPCFAFSASLLFCFCAFIQCFYFVLFLQSCVFAALLLPAALLLGFLSVPSLDFSFSFALFSPVCILNETLEKP